MKKLIISEMVSIILVLGIFLLVFTPLNGWEKIGKERYFVAVIAALVAAGVVAAAVTAVIVATAIVFVAPFVAIAAIVAIIAVGATAIVVNAAAHATAIVVITAIVVFAALVAVGVAAIGIGVEETREINVPKKAIWLSLGTEAVVIILPIILITFY